MSVTMKQPSKRVTTAPLPNTQVSSRNDIFNKEEQVDEEALGEDTKRMDLLMRQLMGDDNDEEEKEVQETMEVEAEEEAEEEEFSFRLFSNSTVSTVKIADEKDTTDHLSKLIADQQEYEFDETDPEFLARVNQAVVDYDTILKQSTMPYPTLRLPRRVLHISSTEKETEKIKKKKRKSKKCRDFEKAVKEGKIVLKENMRKSENGWPGWPGTLTRVAIIDYKGGKKHTSFNGGSSRGGGRGGSSFRGNSRGGMSNRGSFRGGRGRSF